MTQRNINLLGRVVFSFDLVTLSGLHIGGTEEGISIGGVDKTVIRNPVTNRPYIPGSSLRGKIRSLLEKYSGAPQNKSIGRDVTIHVAKDWDQYNKYPICQVFGLPGESKIMAPTRLIVRDVPLDEDSAEELNRLRTALPYTEVKTEVAIDRVTSAATPRQMERVPAGAKFGRAEIVYSLYDITTSANDRDKSNIEASNGIDKDISRLQFIITGLELLEDDYLGGLGSRGSGKVSLKDIILTAKVRKGHEPTNYHYQSNTIGEYESLTKLVTQFDTKPEQGGIKAKIKELFN